MQLVSFFRNLNLGQQGMVSRVQLLAAFASVGADDAWSFQTNGTVVCASSDPDTTISEVLGHLAREYDWRGRAWARTVGDIVQLMSALPPELSGGRAELSFFDIESAPIRLPVVGRRCTVVASGVGYAISVNEREAESNATPMLERALGIPVTSRGMPSMLRLMRRLKP